MKTHPKWFLILGSLHPLLLLKVHSLLNSRPSLFYSQTSFSTLNLHLSLKNLSFTQFLFLPTFAFHAVFHTTRAHTASSFSFRWNPTPWRNNHLRRLVILRHTSPPMLATLWNKRQSGVNSRWCSSQCSSFLKISINFSQVSFVNDHSMITTSHTRLWICHLSGWLAKYHCYRLPLVCLACQPPNNVRDILLHICHPDFMLIVTFLLSSHYDFVMLEDGGATEGSEIWYKRWWLRW